MATAELLRVGRKKRATVELDPAVFEVDVKPHLFHAEVRRQLARRRRGSSSTKNRAAVTGGGEKPWRQKGSGRSRQGSIRAPQWAGGGVVFGPVPRSYEHSLPKTMRRAALRGALTLWARERRLAVIEELRLEEGKTKAVVGLLHGLGLDGRERVLIVIEAADLPFERAARNLPWLSVLRAEGLNLYDVLRHQRLLMTAAALRSVEARLGGKSEEEPA